MIGVGRRTIQDWIRRYKSVQRLRRNHRLVISVDELFDLLLDKPAVHPRPFLESKSFCRHCGELYFESLHADGPCTEN